jgi:hypothetical protein
LGRFRRFGRFGKFEVKVNNGDVRRFLPRRVGRARLPEAADTPLSVPPYQNH